MAICDPAEVSAFEFLFGDDAYELFGVSCCDSFTDDDSEVIDDELFEDCKGSATNENVSESAAFLTLRVDWKVHCLVWGIELDVIEHLEEVNEGEFSWACAICERAHIEGIYADECRLRVCAGDFFDACETFCFWDATSLCCRRAGVIFASAGSGRSQLSTEVHACLLSFAPSARLTTGLIRSRGRDFGCELRFRNPNALSI